MNDAPEKANPSAQSLKFSGAGMASTAHATVRPTSKNAIIPETRQPTMRECCQALSPKSESLWRNGAAPEFDADPFQSKCGHQPSAAPSSRKAQRWLYCGVWRTAAQIARYRNISIEAAREWAMQYLRVQE